MKRTLWCVFASLFVASLSGCGVDGEPTSPPPKPVDQPGIRVSGDARVGVSVSRDAVDLWSVEKGGFADKL